MFTNACHNNNGVVTFVDKCNNLKVHNQTTGTSCQTGLKS